MQCVWAGLLLGIPAALGQSYIIQTVAGTTRLKDGAPAANTPLRYPWGVAQDASGKVYIADERDNRILMIDTSGSIHAIAGTGLAGFSGDGGPASKAAFDSPRSLALDGKGGLYVTDYNNSRVRMINLTTGIINTVVGNGKYQYSGDGGPATMAGVDVTDIAVDSAGNVYIADFYNNRIRKVNAANQTISTIAGQSVSGQAGDGGQATSAVLNGPLGVSVSPQGVVYFADYFNNYVRAINQQSGVITAFAGNGNFGLATNVSAATAGLFLPMGTAVDSDGNVVILEANFIQRVTLPDGTLHTVAGAIFSFPYAIAAAPNGDILVSDTGNFRVRRLNALINTIAGTGLSNNVPATTAFLNAPQDVAAGSGGNFSIPDTGDSVVRSVAGGTLTNIAGTGVAGNTNGELNFPEGIAVDSQGNVFVADTSNNRIVRLVKGGTYAVVAGDGTAGYAGDHANAAAAELIGPTAVAIDASGNLYIADAGNCAIRMVNTSSIITTIAGNGVCGSTGNNGPATAASVAPVDLTLDGAGNLYLAESATNRVRKINLNTMVISPVAGAGSAGYSGDGGPAISAQLNQPTGVTVDPQGNLFIADAANSVVRMIVGSTIFTAAGTGKYAFDIESGPAVGVSMDPVGVSAAADGSIYVADSFNDRIRKLTPVAAANLVQAAPSATTGVPGSQITLSVTITDASGNPVGGAVVTFTVTSGSATLSASAVQTNASGVATVIVTLGAAGPVQIQAKSGTLPAVTYSLTSSGPQIKSGGVLGAALSNPPVTTLTPGGIASVFGTGFGGPAAYVQVAQSDLVSGSLPTNFKNTCVDINGNKAPIFGLSSTQINFQVPAVASGFGLVKVDTNCGAANEVDSVGVSVPIAAAAPEFFYFQVNADGHNPVAATDAITNAGIAATTLFPGSGFAPAQPGEYITVYATGFGATDPAVAPGQFLASLAKVTSPVTVMLNGQPLPASAILYTGITPSSPGLYQLNFQVPMGTPNGDLPLVITIGGVQSPAGAFITVQAPAA